MIFCTVIFCIFFAPVDCLFNASFSFQKVLLFKMGNCFTEVGIRPSFPHDLSKPEKLNSCFMFSKSFITIGIVEQKLRIQWDLFETISQIVHCALKFSRTIFFQIHLLLTESKPQPVIRKVLVICVHGIQVHKNELYINVDIFDSTELLYCFCISFAFG